MQCVQAIHQLLARIKPKKHGGGVDTGSLRFSSDALKGFVPEI